MGAVAMSWRLWIVIGSAFALGGLFLCLNTHSGGPSARKERADQPVEALAFRQFRSIGGPNGVMPENALMEAKARRDAMIVPRPLNAGVGPMSWTWLGPGNIGGGPPRARF